MHGQKDQSSIDWVYGLECGDLICAAQNLELSFKTVYAIKTMTVDENEPLLLLNVNFPGQKQVDVSRINFSVRYNSIVYEGSCQVQNFATAFKLMSRVLKEKE